jgi:hypothetical protein
MNTPCPSSGYTDYTTSNTLGVPDLHSSMTYSGTVTTNYSSASEYIKIWIDWDNNGTFATSEEVASFGPISNVSTGAFFFTVPAAVSPGFKRMRVALDYALYPSGPCAYQAFGEVHDYKVSVVVATPCVNPPVAGTAVATPPGISCIGKNVTLDLIGITISNGQSYDWERSTDNINFTSISGPSLSSNKTIVTTGPAYYRCKVSCNNNTPSISTTVFIDVSPGIAGYTPLMLLYLLRAIISKPLQT